MPAHEGSDPSDCLSVVGFFREVLRSVESSGNSPWALALAGEAGSLSSPGSLSDSPVISTVLPPESD